MKSKYISTAIYFLLLVSQIPALNSCKKFVEVDNPIDQMNSDNVYTDSSTATSAIIGIYSEMMNARNLFSNSSTTLYGGLFADELYYYTPSIKDEFSNNQITQVSHVTIDNSFWKPAYKFIYAANLALEKINASQLLSASLKSRLTGEAKFIRAFCYFHLVNLFGDVPLIISSRYQNAAIVSRTASASVYDQIITDLSDAKMLLGSQYLSAEKIRPNKWTAAALLSRCYLYTNHWPEAESEAGAVISSGQYSLESNLNNTFLKNSSEAIWQLYPVRPGFNTYDGLEILPPSNLSPPTYLLTPFLCNSFENGDARKTAWVKSRVFNNDTLYFPFKYKVVSGTALSEYYMVFRLAEQYLIRAEAEIYQNKITLAQADINVIRNRAGLGNTVSNDIQTLKLALEQERRIELFCEWGYRWYDLKRSGRANDVLSVLKGSNWQLTDILWPIPQQEIDLNRSLTQNPGY